MGSQSGETAAWTPLENEQLAANSSYNDLVAGLSSEPNPQAENFNSMAAEFGGGNDDSGAIPLNEPTKSQLKLPDAGALLSSLMDRTKSSAKKNNLGDDDTPQRPRECFGKDDLSVTLFLATAGLITVFYGYLVVQAHSLYREAKVKPGGSNLPDFPWLDIIWQFLAGWAGLLFLAVPLSMVGLIVIAKLRKVKCFGSAYLNTLGWVCIPLIFATLAYFLNRNVDSLWAGLTVGLLIAPVAYWFLYGLKWPDALIGVGTTAAAWLIVALLAPAMGLGLNQLVEKHQENAIAILEIDQGEDARWLIAQEPEQATTDSDDSETSDTTDLAIQSNTADSDIQPDSTESSTPSALSNNTLPDQATPDPSLLSGQTTGEQSAETDSDTSANPPVPAGPGLIEKALADLSEFDPETRQAALGRLAEVESTETSRSAVHAALAELLVSRPVAETHAAALRVAAHWQHPALPTYVQLGMESYQPEVWLAAGEIAAEQDMVQLLPALIEKGGDAPEAVELIKAFGPSAEPVILAALNRPRSTTPRIALVDVLLEMESGAALPLIVKMSFDEDWSVAEPARVRWKKIDADAYPAIDLAVGDLTYSDPERNAAGLKTLNETPIVRSETEDVGEGLTEYVSRNFILDEQELETTIKAYVRWNDRSSIATLRNWISDEHASDAKRKVALEVLSRLQVPGTLPMVQRWLILDQDAAVRAILRYDPKRAESSMLRLLGHSNKDIVIGATRVLEQVGTARVLPSLKSISRNGSIEEVAASLAAIAAIEQREAEQEAEEEENTPAESTSSSADQDLSAIAEE